MGEEELIQHLTDAMVLTEYVVAYKVIEWLHRAEMVTIPDDPDIALVFENLAHEYAVSRMGDVSRLDSLLYPCQNVSSPFSFFFRPSP